MAATTNNSLSPLSSHTPTSAAATGSKRKRSKYTRRACTLCKMAHAKCGHERPCKRCVSMGRADECIDAERKKRRRRQKFDGQFFDLKDLIPKIRSLPEWDPNDPRMRPYEELEHPESSSSSIPHIGDNSHLEDDHQYDEHSPEDSPYMPSNQDDQCFHQDAVHMIQHLAQKPSTARAQPDQKQTPTTATTTTTPTFASFDSDMLNLDDLSRDTTVGGGSQGVVDTDDSFLLNLDDDQLHSENKSWMPTDAHMSSSLDESHIDSHSGNITQTAHRHMHSSDDEQKASSENVPHSSSTTLQVYQPQLHQETHLQVDSRTTNKDDDNQQLMQAIEGGNLERFSPELVQQLVFMYLKQRDELNQLRSTIGYLQNMIANFVLQQQASNANGNSPLPSSQVGGFDSFPRESEW